MASRRVLITGGAGFLGYHLAEAFQREGSSVRLFDLAECPAWAFQPGIEYLHGDVCNPGHLAAAMEGVDSVVHAAFASPRQTPGQIQTVNVHGTHETLAQALAWGARRFILISSTIVQRRPRRHPLWSQSSLTRLDLYRSSRAEAERIASDYGRRGLSVAIVRPKTFLGPGRVSAFSIIFECIRLGRRVPVLGPVRSRYQLLEIRDMAEGVRLLAGTNAAGLFFLGAREFGTMGEDLQSLLDHAQTEAKLLHVPALAARIGLRGMELAGIVPPSEWHYMSAQGIDSVVDTSRAERELGWQPQWSNAQALRNAYDWYVKSIQDQGWARTTHPVPQTHLALKHLLNFFLG